MLAALAFWGFQATESTPLNAVLGIVAPVIAATIWGLFLSPRRRYDMAVPIRVAIELAVFAVATIALLAAGQPILAIIFGVVALAQRVVLSALGDHSARVAKED